MPPLAHGRLPRPPPSSVPTLPKWIPTPTQKRTAVRNLTRVWQLREFPDKELAQSRWGATIHLYANTGPQLRARPATVEHGELGKLLPLFRTQEGSRACVLFFCITRPAGHQLLTRRLAPLQQVVVVLADAAIVFRQV